MNINLVSIAGKGATLVVGGLVAGTAAHSLVKASQEPDASGLTKGAAGLTGAAGLGGTMLAASLITDPPMAHGRFAGAFLATASAATLIGSAIGVLAD